MSLVIIVSLPFLVWIYFYELVSQDILSISDTAGVIRSICNIKKKFSYLVYPASKRGGELYGHIEKSRIALAGDAARYAESDLKIWNGSSSFTTRYFSRPLFPL